MQVSNDSYTVLVYNITRQQLGDYYCYYHASEEHTMKYSKTVLWYYEPSVWVIYERNFLTGGIAAAGFFLIAVTLCLLDAYRWRPKPTSITNYYRTNIYQMAHAHTNLAYDANDVCVDRIRLPRFDVAMPVPDYFTDDKQVNGPKPVTSPLEGVTGM